jgi:hypothetical protein
VWPSQTMSETLIQAGGCGHHIQLCMRETRSSCQILVCKPEAHGWEGNIKMDFRGTSCKGVICIELP